MRKSLFVFVAATLLMLAANKPAFGASTTLTLTGTPTSIKQGASAMFTITVGATGQINLNQLPAGITLQTVYTAGGGSSTNAVVGFTAPSTPGAGCDIYMNGNSAGQCKPAQNASVDGSGVINAQVSVPANLTPGPYTITITGTATDGVTLPSPMPSFEIQVLPAGHAPTVTINTPANGSSYVYGAKIQPSVSIDSDTDPYLSSYSACFNGDASVGCDPGDPVSLTQDSNDNSLFTGSEIQVTQICGNTFSAYAENSAGSDSATSSFNVHYTFGGWLPPITTAKFQAGRTLPVMFQVNGVNGPIDIATPVVKLDNVAVGTATVMYDVNHVPYYQLNVKLSTTGMHTISLTLGDEACGGTDLRAQTITVK